MLCVLFIHVAVFVQCYGCGFITFVVGVSYGVLKWTVLAAGFIDEECVVFDTEEENKLEYTLLHEVCLALFLLGCRRGRVCGAGETRDLEDRNCLSWLCTPSLPHLATESFDNPQSHAHTPGGSVMVFPVCTPEWNFIHVDLCGSPPLLCPTFMVPNPIVCTSVSVSLILRGSSQCLCVCVRLCLFVFLWWLF